MGTTKKPRKAYRPRTAPLLSPVYFIGRMKPADGPAKRYTQLRYHGALDNLVHGRGTKADWQDLAEALNMTLLLCEQGVGAEHLAFAQEAMQVMFPLRDRFHRCGSMVPTGPERKTLILALDLHDQQLESGIHAGLVEDCYDEMNRRIAAGKFISPELPEHKAAA